MPFLRKRAAHLFSKTRFIAAQFVAYFHDDLWLENARTANRCKFICKFRLHTSNGSENRNLTKMALLKILEGI